jgi:hypothetical protein
VVGRGSFLVLDKRNNRAGLCLLLTSLKGRYGRWSQLVDDVKFDFTSNGNTLPRLCKNSRFKVASTPMLATEYDYSHSHVSSTLRSFETA